MLRKRTKKFYLVDKEKHIFQTTKDDLDWFLWCEGSWRDFFPKISKLFNIIQHSFDGRLWITFPKEVLEEFYIIYGTETKELDITNIYPNWVEQSDSYIFINKPEKREDLRLFRLEKFGHY